MYPEFNAQSSQTVAVQRKHNNQHMIPPPSLAADVFNIWWQKTTAQNRSMLREAPDLMRAHRLINSACQLRARQVQRVIEGHHARS
jgi:hypothetical protein